jgi:hypothetical protein
MAYYLVSAIPRADRLADLEARLARDEFATLRPFGPTLSTSLRNARRGQDGMAVWEEEDYCTPPLAQERAAVLDHYFDGLHTELVGRGDGWTRVAELPALFPSLHGDAGSAG